MKKICLVAAAFVIALSASTPAFAGVSFTVNGKEAAEGEALYFSKSNLDAGRIIFSTPAPAGALSAEISVDGGRRWEAMSREGAFFSYKYRPSDDDKLTIAFLFKDEDGNSKIHSTHVTVYYYRVTPEEAIIILLDRMKAAYEAEHKGRFMEYFSMRYPDRIKFEEGIQNDFYNYNNIRLFYRIDRRTMEPNQQNAIWDVHWERKYLDRKASSFSNSADIAMRFGKEGSAWLVSGMRGNTIFGSSVLAAPDLTITTSDISGGYVGADYVIRAVIHNRGSASADNVAIQFYYPTASTLNGTETLSTIGAGSKTTVTRNLGAIVPVPGEVARVVIDPNRAISEDNEDNNEAQKTFPL